MLIAKKREYVTETREGGANKKEGGNKQKRIALHLHPLMTIRTSSVQREREKKH